MEFDIHAIGRTPDGEVRALASGLGSHSAMGLALVAGPLAAAVMSVRWGLADREVQAGGPGRIGGEDRARPRGREDEQ